MVALTSHFLLRRQVSTIRFAVFARPSSRTETVAVNGLPLCPEDDAPFNNKHIAPFFSEVVLEASRAASNGITSA